MRKLTHRRLPVVSVLLLLLCVVLGARLYRAGRQTLASLERTIEPALEQYLGRDVTIGRAYASGFSAVVVENLAVADGPTFRSGTLLRARRARLTLNVARLLRTRRVGADVIQGVRIEAPEVTVIRDADGGWNVSSLLKGGGKLPAGAFRGRVELVDGQVTLRDHRSFLRPSPAVTHLKGIAATYDASAGTPARITFSARGDGAALGRLSASGSYDETRRELDLQAQVDGASIPHWQRYFRAVRSLQASSGVAAGDVKVHWKAGSRPTVTATVAGRDVAATSRQLRRPLVAESLSARIQNDRMHLEARGSTGGTRVLVDGDVTLRKGGGTMDLRVSVPQATLTGLQRNVRGLPNLSGIAWDAPAEVVARARGHVRHWTVDVDARVPRGSARGIAFTQLRANVEYSRDTRRAEVRHVEARAAGSTVTASGSVDYRTPSGRVAFSGQARGVDLARFPMLSTLRREGTADVRFQVRGTTQQIAADVQAAGSRISLGPARFGRLNADIAYRTGAAPVVRARASGIRPVGTAAARVPFPTAGSVTLEVLPGTIRVSDGRAVLLGMPVRVSGTVSRAGALDLNVAAQRLPAATVVGMLPGGTSRGALALAPRGATFDVAKLKGDLSVSARVTGTASRPRLAGEATLTRGSAGPVTFARAHARFDVASARQGTITFSADDARVQGIALRSVSAQAILRDGRVELPEAAIVLPAGRVAAHGTITHAGALDLRISAAGLDAATMAESVTAASKSAGAPPLSGTVAFEGALRGSVAAPVLEGALDAANGSARGFAFDDLRAGVRATPTGVVIRDAAVRRGEETLVLTGVAEIPRVGGVRLAGRFVARSADVAGILRALNVSANLAGTGNADLEVSGVLPALTVAGDFAIENARVAGVPVGRMQGRLSREGDRTQVEQLEVEDGAARLTASGSMEPGGQLALEVRGTQVPLDRLAGLTASRLKPTGRVDFSGTLGGTLVDPELRVRVTGGQVALNGQGFDSVAGEMGYAGGEAWLADVRLVQGEVVYEVQRAALSTRQKSLRLEATVRDADVERLLTAARSVKLPDTPEARPWAARLAALPTPMRGRMDLKVRLDGPTAHPYGSIEFALRDALLGETPLRRFAGTASWRPGYTEIRDTVIAAEGVDVSGSVAHGPGDRLAVDATLNPSRLEALRRLAAALAGITGPVVATGAPETPRNTRPEVPLLAALSRLPEPFTGGVSGSIRLTGSAAAPEGIATLALQDAHLGDAVFRQAGGQIRWAGGGLRVDDLALRAPGIDVTGQVERQPGGGIAVSLNVRDTDLAAARDLTRTAAAVAASYRGAPVLSESVMGMIEDLPTPLAGKVTAALTLSGTPGALRGTFAGEGRELRLGEAALATAAAEGEWSPAGVRFPRLSLSGQGCAITGSLSTSPRGQIEATFATESARLEQLRALVGSAEFLRRYPAAGALLDRVRRLPSPLSGTVTAEARLSGTLADPEAQVSFDGADLVVGSHALAQLAGAASMRGGVVTLSRVDARANGGSLRAEGTVDLDGAINVTLSGTDFALDVLRPLAGSAEALGGHLDITATVSGTVEAPEARASFQIRDATVAGMRFERVSAQAVRVAEGRIDLGNVELAGDKLTGSVSGSVPFHWRPVSIPADEPIQLSVSLPAQDLALPAGIASAVASASGKMGADMVVTGTLRDPNMSGSVTLRDGKVKLTSLENAFGAVNADFRLEGSAVVVERLTGRSDRGGGFQASGKAVIRGDSGRTLDLRIATTGGGGLQVAVQDVAGIPGLHFSGTLSTTTRGTAGGAITISGPLAQPVVSGQARLSQAQLTVPNEMPARPKAQPLPINPVLDLEIAVGDGTWVRRGHALSAMLSGSMLARGTLRDPSVGGRVVVERGEMHYASVNFRLQQGGTVSFSYDPPAPLSARLDVYALTRVRSRSQTTNERRNYDITMHLTGALPAVNVAITSDPPDLPQHRLMAILARTDQVEALARGEDLDTILRDQITDVIAGSVLPQVFEPIEEGIIQALGLDDLTFDYGFDQPLRVDARKEILPRLYLSYNRDLGAGPVGASREEWSVTYRVYQRLFVGWRKDAMKNKERLVIEGSFRF